MFSIIVCSAPIQFTLFYLDQCIATRFHFPAAALLSLRETTNLLVAFTTSVVPLINFSCPRSSPCHSSRQASNPLAAASRAAATSSPSADLESPLSFILPSPPPSSSSLSASVTFFTGRTFVMGLFKLYCRLCHLFCSASISLVTNTASLLTFIYKCVHLLLLLDIYQSSLQHCTLLTSPTPEQTRNDHRAGKSCFSSWDTIQWYRACLLRSLQHRLFNAHHTGYSYWEKFKIFNLPCCQVVAFCTLISKLFLFPL